MVQKNKQNGSVPLRTLIVADDEHLVAEGIANGLRSLGYTVIATCPDGQDAIEVCKNDKPDMALLDIRMPNMNGLDAAKVIFGEFGIPVVIISAYSDPEYAAISANVGVFGYLLKPVSPDDLRTALAVAWGQFITHTQAKGEIQQLSKRLEDRKIIERAKWIMVDKLGLTEEDAMRKLQKQARDRRRTLADVASGILENQELFNAK